jgi:hypothetical protein
MTERELSEVNEHPADLRTRSLIVRLVGEVRSLMVLNAELQVGNLQKALRHEVFGNEPCDVDCEPGGWRKCIGCDKRAKAALRDSQPSKPVPMCKVDPLADVFPPTGEGSPT